MPFLSPHEIAVNLPAGNPEAQLFLIEKLEPAEMLEFLKLKKVQAAGSVDARDSLFEIVFRACSYQTALLKVFLKKLINAIDFQESEDKEKIVSEFVNFYNQAENAEVDPKRFNPFAYINPDDELLKMLTVIFGNRMLNSDSVISKILVASNVSVSNTARGIFVKYISDETFKKLVKRAGLSSANKKVLTEVFLRATPEQIQPWLNDSKLLVRLGNLFPEPEIIEFILIKFNAIQLHDAIQLNFIKLMIEMGLVDVWTYLLPKISPFKFKFELGQSNPTFIQYAKKSKHPNLPSECLEICEMIDNPSKFLEANPDKFIQQLQIYLDTDGDIHDAMKWKDLLLNAIKSCPKKRADVLEKMDAYLRKLNKRPEFAVSSGAVSSYSGASLR